MIDISGPFCRVSFEPVNLNSHQQLKDFLLTQGWKPDSWTDKGSPQLTESSYPSINGQLGQLIAKRAVLKHRMQMIFNVDKKGKEKGWLNTMRADGRVEAGAMTNSTNTARMAHRGIVNVPKPKDIGLWPSDVQLRELFIVPDNKLMMGIDADGLEARMEAHCCLPYKGGEAYAHDLIDGDIHAKNMEIFGTDREGAKAPKYALTYGCQPATLAKTLGCPVSKAKGLFEGFWRTNTALKGFKEAITKYWKDTGKKYIKGIDGRRIAIRSEHSIVNAYFQSTGSIAVKVAALFLDKACRARGMEAQQIIIYHDELEYELPVGEKELLAELSSESFVKSGQYLKLRVPTTGSPKFGGSWRDVH